MKGTLHAEASGLRAGDTGRKRYVCRVRGAELPCGALKPAVAVIEDEAMR